MSGNMVIYIGLMGLITYGIRLLPFLLLRREIKNRFIRSFLYYVPYVTLSLMIFPAILYSTASIFSAALGLIVAVFLAYRGKGLIQIALTACIVVFAVELLPI